MFNAKVLSGIAFMLIIIGIVGVLFTFDSAKQVNKTTTHEEFIDSDRISDIEVETDNMKIEVLPTNEDSIKLELKTNDKQAEIITDINNSTLFITAKQKRIKLFNFDFFSLERKLTVYLPEKNYESLQVETNNGLINVNGLILNNLKVATDNGQINLENLVTEMVEAETSNGRIIFDHVKGEIIGKTANGIIKLTAENLNDPINLETNNGKIDVRTENKPTNVTFDIRVDNGTAKVFGDSNWDTVIGNGENLIKLITNNGIITVTK